MIILRRNPLFALTFIVCLLALASCRTSQRESRSANAARNSGGSSSAVSRQMDSLLMIEQKLTEVIDSMASLVDADHRRIRALEQEVQALQNQSQSYSAHPPMPPNDPTPSNNAYLAPPTFTSPTPNISPSAAPIAPVPPSTTTPNNFQQRYTDALGLYNDNNFEAALEQFRALEQDDPNGVYASNYKYWEGECYYGEKRYNKALETFGIVLNQYPNSTKVVASLFKTGECYERLKDSENARAAYERVLADYPTSEYHARALARLKALSH